MAQQKRAPQFMLVAGELSGDLLGAGLIEALKVRYPDAHFFGVGGPLMIEAGLESIEPIETLSVMGLVEVIKHLPTLLKLKKRLVNLAQECSPDLFIGIDSPDFNLRLSKSLTQQKITKTVQYVSPSIWVWREGRAKSIRRYVDRVLCLFPFEVELYKKYGVDAVCVGHRLGDEIPMNPDPNEAKEQLGLAVDQDYIAILPGSRMGEIERLLPLFLASVGKMHQRRPNLRYLIPAANSKIYAEIERAIESQDPSIQALITLFQGRSRQVMAASKSVLLASGTASLEAMLLKKPMVVTYRFSAFTAWLAPKIVKIRRFSLPNILAQKELVPELFQDAVTVENIVEHLERSLDSNYRATLLPQFYHLHHQLRLNSDQRAAESLIELLERV